MSRPSTPPRPAAPRAPDARPPGTGTDADLVRVASPRRLTSATISLGVVVAAACFLVAGAAELLGRQPHADGMTDVRTLLDGTLSLDPWAWASLGTFVVVLTPAVALVVTAWEYRSIADHRAMLLALVVLAVLVISAAVAVLGY